jgi:hypothetical protein
MCADLEREKSSVQPPSIIVGHLAPDLDCLIAIWILVRFGEASDAAFQFVPAGQTLDDRPPDSDPTIVHVDTGGGCFDHHQHADPLLSASELVRRAVAPGDRPLQRLVEQVTRLDNATCRGKQSIFFNINDLIDGYNALFPNKPHHVAQAMLPNFDAWYEHEMRELRLEQAFARRLEFYTCWGLGIAMQSNDGASSRLAYRHGAVLYVYRNGSGYMGIAAQSRSDVDLQPVYTDLKRLDPDADWYLHPNHRLLLCGTAKAPPRQKSRLSLEELVEIIRSEGGGFRRQR